MGRDWLGQFVVNLKDVHKYSDVFKDELGCLKGMPVKLLVHENAKPKFFKPRPVPILLKDKVTKELEDLQAKGIISPVQSSPWAAPVVPVKSGSVATIKSPTIRLHLLRLTPYPELRSCTLNCLEESSSQNWIFWDLGIACYLPHYYRGSVESRYTLMTS